MRISGRPVLVLADIVRLFDESYRQIIRRFDDSNVKSYAVDESYELFDNVAEVSQLRHPPPSPSALVM